MFCVPRSEVDEYVVTHPPIVLRDGRRFDPLDLVAQNVGVAKGSTYERVLIFPTSPMLKYLRHRDPSQLKAPERLHVAVTRAKHTVAFVMPDWASSLLLGVGRRHAQASKARCQVFAGGCRRCLPAAGWALRREGCIGPAGKRGRSIRIRAVRRAEPDTTLIASALLAIALEEIQRKQQDGRAA